MKNSPFRSLAIILMVFCSFSVLSAQAWIALGDAKVHGHVDHDEIWVTDAQGNFKAIKLFVKNEGIDFDRVIVHFGNGGHDVIPIKNFIPAGGETRVIDLPGGDRVIKKVEFYYKSNAATSQKARVVLFGRR